MSSLNYIKEENNTLISRLYALRAGLSVATTEAENAKRLDMEEQALNDKKNDEIKSYREDITKQQQKLCYIENNISRNESTISYEKDIIKRYGKPLLINIFLISLYLIATLVFLKIFIEHNRTGSKDQALYFIALIICGILFLVRLFKLFFPLSPYWQIKEEIYMVFSAKRTMREQKNNEKRLQKELLLEQKKLKNLLDKEQNFISDTSNKFVPQIKEKQNKKDYHIRAGVIFCSCLDRQFCDLIDRRDWKYVDYLIFCLETGRADTLKESLKLADEENRTQRLENAIEQAQSSIKNTLNSRFKSLQSTMTNEFASLQSTISHTISSMSTQVSSLQSSVNSRLSEISSAQYVSNSLMKNMAHNTYVMANSCDYLNAHNPLYY